MMQSAVTSLISRLEGVEDDYTEHIVVPPELIVRLSTSVPKDERAHEDAVSSSQMEATAGSET